MIILVIILGIIIILQSFFLYNLFKQNEDLEKVIISSGETDEKLKREVLNYYLAFLNLFMEADQQMERIDKRGSFSSDDEVGFAFKVIKTAIKNVIEKIKEFEPEEEEND